MKVKFIEIDKIQIAYSEKNRGFEPILFFVHGNSGSRRAWQKQFESPLFQQYHLIAFDLPGCGDSIIGTSKEWDYSPVSTGRVIAKAVKQLAESKSFALVGFSFGTNVVAEALDFSLSPKAISLLSPCIVGAGLGLDKIFVAGDYIFFHDNKPLKEVRDFFAGIANSDYTEVHVEDYFRAKPPFRSKLIQSVGEGKLADEVQLVKNQNIPVQVIFGKNDTLLQINYLDHLPFKVWKNNIYKLQSAGHYLQDDRHDTFNQLLAEYVDESLKQ